MAHVEELPNELLEYILYNVDQETIRVNCINVSKTWRNIIQSVPFWKRYHRYWKSSKGKKSTCASLFNIKETGYIPDEMFISQYDWKFFSLISAKANPFEVNLLKNSDGTLVQEEEFNIQNNRYFEGELT